MSLTGTLQMSQQLAPFVAIRWIPVPALVSGTQRARHSPTACYLVGVRGLEPRTSSSSGNAIGRSYFRILGVNCGEWSADVHGRMSLSRAVVTQLVTRLGLDELAEYGSGGHNPFHPLVHGSDGSPRGPGVRFGERRILCGGSD